MNSERMRSPFGRALGLGSAKDCVEQWWLERVGLPVSAASVLNEPPAASYKQMSALVKLPDFVPGLGALHVDTKTLPKDPVAWTFSAVGARFARAVTQHAVF
jgi:hypothetical protein